MATPKIAELMANEETDLSSGTRVDVEYDMCRAAAEGDQVRVRTLVDCCVSVNAVDYGNRSALHLAATNGHYEVIKILLMNEADLNLKDRLGRTALDDARHEGHVFIARLIEEASRTIAISSKDSSSLYSPSDGETNIQWIECFFPAHFEADADLRNIVRVKPDSCSKISMI